MQANNFLEDFPFSGIPIFEAAILTNKPKVRMLEMVPMQSFTYKIKASFVPNSKLLPRLTQCLHVSALLLVTYVSLLHVSGI